jgi:squalene-hopene/tetraprenyl-beta-curcumene cyclase
MAKDDVPRLEPASFTSARGAVARGLDYLIGSQAADGGWEAFGRSHPAVTALAVKSLAQDARYGPVHPSTRRGLEFMLRFTQPDGGVYVADEGQRNYHTSVALMALSAMRNASHEESIRNAQRFLKELQWDDGEGYESSSPWFGGQGYGRHQRPDLSNTQMMLEALRDSGLPADDPVYRKALVFVERCQMLASSNDQPFAQGRADGGFVYTPANGGESMAGTEPADGRSQLRCYGSMTYAGFKSLLYAQLHKDDPRVAAALGWIRRSYTLDQNPNMPETQGKQGLYYYYHVFARALHAWGEDIIEDGSGRPHAWREELCSKLVALQRDDGSWLNEADRWYEGNPHLVTAYAILALQTALEKSR